MKNNIENTNRTILFDEINSNKLNLLTILGDIEENGTISDTIIEEINKHLVVSSFEEFLEKFSPVIYSFFNAQTQSISYVIKKPEGIPESCITEIKLGIDNHFIKMIISLIENRKVQGKKNTDFKFEDILSLLSPTKIIEDIKQSRKEIQYLYNKYASLEDENPEKSDLGYKLNVKFENISKHYNNTLSMLPLAIEDIKTKLLINNQENTKNIQNVKAGLLEMGENGDLKVIEYKEMVDESILPQTSRTDELVQIYRQDYNDVSKTPNSYVEDLVVRTFMPLTKPFEQINIQEELQKYNSYLDFYKTAQESFIKIAKPIIETIVGVKMFFDQYDVKIKKMKPSLLITNISSHHFLIESNVKRLNEYLMHVNNKNDLSSAIWFGIYPNVSFDDDKKISKNIFKTNKEKNTQKNTLTNLLMIASTLAKYKIQIFFNFELNEKMTFENLSINTIDNIEDELKEAIGKEYSEYLIPVIPNFTIIPKSQSGVVLDKKLEFDGEDIKKDEEIKFWIDGVYIASSFVAAGIVGAYQR